jgi:hypothetical protein
MANLDNPVNPLGPTQGDADSPGEIDKIDPSTRVLGNDLVVGRMYWVVRYNGDFFSARLEANLPGGNGLLPAHQWADVKHYATERRGNVRIVGEHTPFMGNFRVPYPYPTREISADYNHAYYPAPDSAKMRGRDLTSVKRVGLAKNLPEDVESVMGSFITGKKGSTKAQMDKLQQEAGLPLAPRAGRRKVTTKKAAKKTCSPGYEVYNFRKTRKGVFYDCAPKRKTRRSRK